MSKQAELLRIGQISGGALAIEQGALYPALHRLEVQGLLNSEWGSSENNRRAKFYRLTPAGRTRLRAETESWNRSASAIATALGAKPQEVWAMSTKLSGSRMTSAHSTSQPLPVRRSCSSLRNSSARNEQKTWPRMVSSRL